MINKQTWLSIVVGVIFLGGGLGLAIWNESRSAEVSNDTSGSETENESYTMTQIAEHGDATSCWTAIEGNVYDMTEYIEEHPGGSRAILVICGSDGTGSFNSMPDAVMPVARMALAKYKIGDLAD